MDEFFQFSESSLHEQALCTPRAVAATTGNP
jgi:hypothetical protein